MARRALTAVLLLAILLPSVYFGGLSYFLLIAVFVGIAVWEYDAMFRLKGFRPSSALSIPAVLLILAARAFWPAAAPMAVAGSVLVAMAVHLVRFEVGRDEAALDLLIDLGAFVYFGWIAAYLLDLRLLSDGMWWLSLVFVAVWVADSAAYFVGARFGRHKLSPRLSPKKSWEGYFAGVVAGTAVAGILTPLIEPLSLSPWQGIGFGLVLSSLTTLGDLGESLFKRYAGIKDSGKLLPGHGGAFDRIDSLIWAGVLGYFWISFVLT